jgi:hypothetical protein
MKQMSIISFATEPNLRCYDETRNADVPMVMWHVWLSCLIRAQCEIDATSWEMRVESWDITSVWRVTSCRSLHLSGLTLREVQSNKRDRGRVGRMQA